MPRDNFGTVEPLPSGSYRAVYRHNKTRYRKTFPSELAARQWLKEEQKLIAYDIWEPPAEREKLKQQKAAPLTVGQWLGQWLEINRTTWKESTYDSHRAVVERRILHATGKAAELARIPLDELTRADVMAWWDAISVTYDTPSRNRTSLVRLTTALGAAVQRGLIPSNPAAHLGIKRPAPHRKELPTTEVMMEIMEHMYDRHKIITALTFFHGMRIGEVLALRRMDIEDDGQQVRVHVRGNAFRKPKVGMVRMDTPKTEAGVRTVPIFPAFVDVVRHHLDTYVAAEPEAMVCTTTSGEIVMDTSYRSRLETAKKHSGHEGVRITPHYGRVWMITTLVEAGMTIPAIGEILGQRDLKTITEVYMRTSEAKKREVLDRVNGIFG